MSDKTDTSGANSHVREMSVTERLRALLDERGVEWRPIAWNPKKETFYYTSDGVGFCADEYVDGVKIYTDALITPEQAIDATLGRGTCEVECFDDGMDEGMDGHWFAYTPPTWYLSCGHEVNGRRPSYCPVCGRKVKEG